MLAAVYFHGLTAKSSNVPEVDPLESFNSMFNAPKRLLERAAAILPEFLRGKSARHGGGGSGDDENMFQHVAKIK